MNDKKKIIRWERHYSDGSFEYTDDEGTRNFEENLSIADGLISSRSYIQMKHVNWLQNGDESKICHHNYEFIETDVIECTECGDKCDVSNR